MMSYLGINSLGNSLITLKLFSTSIYYYNYYLAKNVNLCKTFQKCVSYKRILKNSVVIVHKNVPLKHQFSYLKFC